MGCSCISGSFNSALGCVGAKIMGFDLHVEVTKVETMSCVTQYSCCIAFGKLCCGFAVGLIGLNQKFGNFKGITLYPTRAP